MFRKSKFHSLIIWTAFAVASVACSPEGSLAPTAASRQVQPAATVAAPAATDASLVPVVARISSLTADISVSQPIGLLGGDDPHSAGWRHRDVPGRCGSPAHADHCHSV